MCHFFFSLESASNLQMVRQNIFGWPKAWEAIGHGYSYFEIQWNKITILGFDAGIS